MSIIDQLPPSLNLPPHLSAHKYFLVCTLTVAAWDTLVLSPRTWRLMKTPGWPALKTLFHFLRVFMPVEFIIVGTLATHFLKRVHGLEYPQRSPSSTRNGLRQYVVKWLYSILTEPDRFLSELPKVLPL